MMHVTAGLPSGSLQDIEKLYVSTLRNLLGTGEHVSNAVMNTVQFTTLINAEAIKVFLRIMPSDMETLKYVIFIA